VQTEFIAALYATEDPRRAPDRVLVEALATIDTTRQRRELMLVPWSLQTMNSYAKLAIAAVVAVVVGILGLAILRPDQGPARGPDASASTFPALTRTFTSAIHHVSISYPANWTTGSGGPSFMNPAVDYLHDPALGDHVFISLRSEALDGQTGLAWATAFFNDPVREDCTAEPEPITVDGAPGLICDTVALTWVGNRGYDIRLVVLSIYPGLGEFYNRAWFEDVLATVRLPPGS
jgi:hypothetical protein